MFLFNRLRKEQLLPRLAAEISKCHTCGSACDRHYNCAWDLSHKLFIQCLECREKFSGCCSEDCTHSYLTRSVQQPSKAPFLHA